MRVRWFLALAILGLALTYRLLGQGYTAREWPQLNWVVDVLFYGLAGALTVWITLTWIVRRSSVRPEEAQHLASVVRSSLDAIVTVDQRWVIKTWNRGAQLVFGYRTRQMIGQPFDRLLPRESTKQGGLEALSKQMEEAGHIEGRDVEMLSSQRERITVHLVGNALSEDGRRVTGYSLVMREVTAARLAEQELRTLYGELEEKMRERTRKLELARHQLEQRNAQLHQAYQELKELDHLKSDFVSMVSHELRSPLTNISGAVELMLQEEELSDEYVRRMLGVVGEQSERLIRLVRGVLDVSRIDAGRLYLDRQEVDLFPVLQRVVSSLQATTDFHWFELPSADSLPTVWGDEDRIEQIFFNLLDNAVKFSLSGGPIKIQMEAGEEEIMLSVTDPGVGIPAAKLDRIFQKFHRLDSDDARETYGHGLGLYITKALVEAHGGRIWAESVEGQGSTFTFTLPVARTVQASEELPPHRPTRYLPADK